MNPAPAKSSISSTAGWLGKQLRDWKATDGMRWLFVLRTLVAAFTALWLAYRFGLDSPSTAMTTTFILALPSSGMVLEKAFYRFLGTIVGCCAMLALVGMFGQQPPLLFVGLALWVALCTAGAAMHRNQQSYSFVLAGYTAVLVFLPALDHPQAAFAQAVTRFSEVGLGIICASVINDVLFPRAHGPLVLRTVQSRFESFLGLCQKVLEHKLPPSEVDVAHMRFAADIAALESGRAAAFFEAAHARSQTRQLHAFNEAFMTALTTFYTLHRLMHRATAQPDSPVFVLLEPLYRQLAAALSTVLAAKGKGAAASFAALGPQLATSIADARDALALSDADGDAEASHRWRIDFDTAVELLERFRRNITDFILHYEALTQKRKMQVSEPQAYAPKTPMPIVIASGARAGAALLMVAVMWYWLAWAPLASTAIFCTVFCALSSSSPRPTASVKQIMYGYLLGIPVMFFVQFGLIIQATNFPMLVISGAPVIALAMWLLSNPATAGIGIGLALFSSGYVGLAQMPHFNVATYFNSAMADVLGVVLAYIAFQVLMPEHTMGKPVHVSSALWRVALDASTARLRGRPGSYAATDRAARRLKHRFDNHVRDLLNQLNAAAGPAPSAEARRVVRQGLTLLELGHSMIDLRALLATAKPGPVQEALRRVAETLTCALREAASAAGPHGAAARAAGQAARTALLEAGPVVRAELPHAEPQRVPRLQAALTDLHSIYTSLLDQENSQGEANHAA